MLLNAEIKDDAYSDLPRQQEAQYAHPAQTYLKADAATGQHYVDLNAAAKTYVGAWLFGRQQVETFVGRLKAQWQQWCPVPAGIADGVLLRGNVMYENGDRGYRMSNDTYEGVLRTEGGVRCFQGQTTHTFYGRNFPGGSLRVQANLNIPLTQRLAYNPMVVMPSRQVASAPARYSGQSYGYANGYGQRQYCQPDRQAYATPMPAASTATYSQEPDSGF